MSERTATAQPSLALGAVRGVVRRVLRKDPHARAIAIRWDRAWSAQPVRLDGVDRATVIHHSDSPLAIRGLLESAMPQSRT